MVQEILNIFGKLKINKIKQLVKIVRESLLEFHQTGDPLGSLNVGTKSEAIEVINFFDGDNKTHPIPVKSEKDIEKLQNMINDYEKLTLVVYFKEPGISTFHQWPFTTFKKLYHDRKNYEIIKYEGHYFHF